MTERGWHCGLIFSQSHFTKLFFCHLFGLGTPKGPWTSYKIRGWFNKSSQVGVFHKQFYPIMPYANAHILRSLKLLKSGSLYALRQMVISWNWPLALFYLHLCNNITKHNVNGYCTLAKALSACFSTPKKNLWKQGVSRKQRLALSYHKLSSFLT